MIREPTPCNFETKQTRMQLDGNATISDAIDNDDSETETEYGTEDEAFSNPIPINLVHNNDITNKLDVDMKNDFSSSLPLFMVLNARSIFNKSRNLTQMLSEIVPDFLLISETFERHH